MKRSEEEFGMYEEAEIKTLYRFKKLNNEEKNNDQCFVNIDKNNAKRIFNYIWTIGENIYL